MFIPLSPQHPNPSACVPGMILLRFKSQHPEAKGWELAPLHR